MSVMQVECRGILEAGKGVQEHNNWRQIDSMRYERKREEGTAGFL